MDARQGCEASATHAPLTLSAGGDERNYIKSAVTIHDRSQIETSFDYKLVASSNRRPLIWRSKWRRFEVEAFFFFPPQMGVSAQTYDKNQFYQDLRPLIRLKEPRFAYKEFIGQVPVEGGSPLIKMQELLAFLSERGKPASPKKEKEGIDLARLFACSFSSYLVKRVNRRCRSIDLLLASNKVEELKALLEHCEPLLERSRDLLKEWHKLDEKVQSTSFERYPALRAEIGYATEYCHYRFREGLARLEAGLQKCRGRFDDPSLALLQRRRKIWIRWLYLISRRRGYYWIDSHSPSLQQEKFIFRLGFLKKRMWQVLYLDLKPRTSFAIRRQFGYMMAAGFAAMWAFLANLLIWNELKFGGFAAFGSPDSLIGLSGLLILLAFMAAYILKDRIKELGRSKFGHGIFGNLPDYNEKVSVSDASGKSYSIGTIEEWMKFLDEEQGVPADIQHTRQAALPQDEMIGREKVIYYRKRLVLNASKLAKNAIPLVAVRDIIRFNMQSHLTKLADPLHRYLSLSRTGKLTPLWIPKNYYVDIILRYSYVNPLGQKEEVALDSHRLVLNKEGLLRIENFT